MVGQATSDGQSPVELLEKDYPGQIVAEGEGREGEEALGSFLHRFCPARGSSDKKDRTAVGYEKPLQPVGKTQRIEAALSSRR